jgi:simple sugar transport system ATP-binding protein
MSKRFGPLLAVDEVYLELFAGQLHALLGENGAGKTTLMCLLAGLYRPDGGTIEINGQRRIFRSPQDAMAASVGMVHQHFMLVPTLTVWENVLLSAEKIPWWLQPKRQIKRVQGLADELGLQIEAAATVETLSVAEQQRVEILRVLIRGARIMILDEPTAVLSPSEAQALFASLERLAQSGCTIVLISH